MSLPQKIPGIFFPIIHIELKFGSATIPELKQ